MDGAGAKMRFYLLLLGAVFCAPLASMAQAQPRSGEGPPAELHRPRKLIPLTIQPQGDSFPVRAAAHEEAAAPAKQWPPGGPQYQAPVPPEPPDLRALVTRFVLGTAVVLVACVACLWLARRWLSHHMPAGKTDSRMKLVATVSLSNRSSLQLVDIEGRKVLVGSDTTGIKTVTPLSESFLDNLQQATEERVGDDREGSPFGSLARQVT